MTAQWKTALVSHHYVYYLHQPLNWNVSKSENKNAVPLHSLPHPQTSEVMALSRSLCRQLPQWCEKVCQVVHSENPPQTLNCFPPRLQREQIQSAVPDSSSVAPPNKAEPVWLSKQPRGYISNFFVFFFKAITHFFFLFLLLSLTPSPHKLPLAPLLPPNNAMVFKWTQLWGVFSLPNVAVLKVRSRWPRSGPSTRGLLRKKRIMD